MQAVGSRGPHIVTAIQLNRAAEPLAARVRLVSYKLNALERSPVRAPSPARATFLNSSLVYFTSVPESVRCQNNNTQSDELKQVLCHR